MVLPGGFCDVSPSTDSLAAASSLFRFTLTFYPSFRLCDILSDTFPSVHQYGGLGCIKPLRAGSYFGPLCGPALQVASISVKSIALVGSLRAE